MHERYAYGALVFFMLLARRTPDPGAGDRLGIVVTLNLLAAVPPTPEIGDLLPIDGALGVAGSLAMLAATAYCLWLLGHPDPTRPASVTTPATDPSPA